MLASREEALEVARRVVQRMEARQDLVARLIREDNLGLECPDSVELERMTDQDAADGRALAVWLTKEPAHLDAIRQELDLWDAGDNPENMRRLIGRLRWLLEGNPGESGG